ncbi:MAG: quinone-dependent dihydroorotate dehydrogenase [Opitutaceae bacterium]|jgi:dihydroorotate dehydrogenase|nr:quinone-dependent dihydroorotate dehydrogenase [Opitutaceae bacterium]
MDFPYERLLRPLLFKLDCETAHNLAAAAMTALGRVPPLCRAMEAANLVRSARPVRVLGLEFPNAVGLAAGFDKHATAWPAAAALGFGHVEVGTLTALAQPGNPKPRAFRYPAREAVINRMGFNNHGAAAAAKLLARQPSAGRRRAVLGVSIGKSKVTPLEQAAADYTASFNAVADHADYVAVNVSSPNTPGLRALQGKGPLVEILSALTDANAGRAAAGKPPRPILLKIAPDLGWGELDAVLATLLDLGVHGIIATNTTLARPAPFDAVNEDGGLSGRPLRERATEVVRYIARATGGRLPIIASGGVMTPADACAKLDAGAALVQLYTGLIYRGPFFAKRIARALANRGWPAA